MIKQINKHFVGKLYQRVPLLNKAYALNYIIRLLAFNVSRHYQHILLTELRAGYMHVCVYKSTLAHRLHYSICTRGGVIHQ